MIAAIVFTAGAATAQDLPPVLAERFSQGVAALKGGDLDTAEQAFREVLRRGGARAFVHHNLGIVLQQRRRHAEALTEFRVAIELDAAFGPARLLAGTSLLALDRPREAVRELQHAVRLLPDEPAAHRELAGAYERTGDIAGMVDEYRRLVQLAPADGEYAYRLGKAYLRLAQWSFARIRTIDPQAARLDQALGQQYLDQGRSDLALAAFERAAARGGSIPEIHLALARIHFDERRLDAAAREVDRELAIAPESAPARALKTAIEAARARQ